MLLAAAADIAVRGRGRARTCCHASRVTLAGMTRGRSSRGQRSCMNAASVDKCAAVSPKPKGQAVAAAAAASSVALFLQTGVRRTMVWVVQGAGARATAIRAQKWKKETGNAGRQRGGGGMRVSGGSLGVVRRGHHGLRACGCFTAGRSPYSGARLPPCFVQAAGARARWRRETQAACDLLLSSSATTTPPAAAASSAPQQ